MNIPGATGGSSNCTFAGMPSLRKLVGRPTVVPHIANDGGHQRDNQNRLRRESLSTQLMIDDKEENTH